MMVRTTLGAALALLCPLALSAQLSFTNSTSMMGASVSGGCMGVVDMNGDGLDDILKLDNARTLKVDYQNANGTFTTVNYGNMSGSGQWGFAAADIDNNGHKDVVSGGSYDGTHYMRINSVGQGTLSDLNGGDIFTQCMSIGDVDNNGRVDVFACHDDGPPSLWFTNASGVPVNNNAYMNWATPECASGPAAASDDMSGNYGSCFTDFDDDGDLDLYIAHCRQGVTNPDDCRRWNRLFVNNGSNQYSDLAANYGVQIRNQSWTADFGDIDNDGDFDMVVTNHDANIQLLRNNGAGQFTDITAGSGLEFGGFMLQSKFADFDNDGFVDVLIAGGVEYYFKNNGNSTFTRITGLFPSNKAMHSFATGDLNNDGFVDLFANYGNSYITPDNANPDRLWMNNANGNHWFGVRLQGTVSNRDAIGARVTITGPWGTQTREVRSGESYGMVTTFAAMFGLGNHTVIPTLTVRWPAGSTETFTNVAADQYINIIEGTCISPTAAITPVGDPVLCGPGDQVALSANAGFQYLWSNGQTSQTINVSAAGNYSVVINDGNGCTATASFFVAQSPDETPTVQVTGPLTFCEGGSVTLTSTAANAYSWTGGGTSQSIQVTSAGSYSVTIDGTCAQFTSAPVLVNVLDAPDAPIADGVNIAVPGTANLSATGNNINWYAGPVGGTPIGSGNAFTTPFVNTNTTFYVTAGIQHGGGAWFGGPQNRLNTGSPGQFHTNSDNYPVFTASAPFTIVSVKVYANGAGNRTVALIDRSSGATLASQAINIPDGESRITLNYAVPGPGEYGLRTVSGNPQLWRDGNGSNPTYPYALGTVGAITTSSVTGNNALNFYYFFYDWEVVAAGTLCESVRVPVEVTVGTVGITEASASGTRVFPNPAKDALTVRAEGGSGITSVELLDVTGRIARSVPATTTGLVQVGLSGIAPGEYLVRVNSADGRSIHRVVVQ
ncbi:MAG: VCBS repeat-containing protein [Flavobacteriales bacterium]|nr:VCBS repeat-containing protein [Flavobacteriales bacterium]